MTGKLNEKVAVITGGTTGIGFATAQRFVAEGAKVIVTGTNAENLDKARAELGTSAWNATWPPSARCSRGTCA